MKVQHTEQEGAGEFFVEIEGTKEGSLFYSIIQNRLAIEHTEATVEGKGIGKALVKAALEYARKNNLEVIAQCSFAKAVMERR